MKTRDLGLLFVGLMFGTPLFAFLLPGFYSSHKEIFAAIMLPAYAIGIAAAVGFLAARHWIRIRARILPEKYRGVSLVYAGSALIAAGLIIMGTGLGLKGAVFGWGVTAAGLVLALLLLFFPRKPKERSDIVFARYGMPLRSTRDPHQVEMVFGSSYPVDLPDVCPECGEELEWVDMNPEGTSQAWTCPRCWKEANKREVAEQVERLGGHLTWQGGE